MYVTSQLPVNPLDHITMTCLGCAMTTENSVAWQSSDCITYARSVPDIPPKLLNHFIACAITPDDKRIAVD